MTKCETISATTAQYQRLILSNANIIGYNIYRTKGVFIPQKSIITNSIIFLVSWSGSQGIKSVQRECKRKVDVVTLLLVIMVEVD